MTCGALAGSGGGEVALRLDQNAQPSPKLQLIYETALTQ